MRGTIIIPCIVFHYLVAKLKAEAANVELNAELLSQEMVSGSLIFRVNGMCLWVVIFILFVLVGFQRSKKAKYV